MLYMWEHSFDITCGSPFVWCFGPRKRIQKINRHNNSLAVTRMYSLVHSVIVVLFVIDRKMLFGQEALTFLSFVGTLSRVARENVSLFCAIFSWIVNDLVKAISVFMIFESLQR